MAAAWRTAAAKHLAVARENRRWRGKPAPLAAIHQLAAKAYHARWRRFSISVAAGSARFINGVSGEKRK